MEAGAAVLDASRAPSANTCLGAQVTPAASHTSPETRVHWPEDEKSSAPSTVTLGPPAWITNGVPEAPEAGIETCSRYVPATTRMVLPAPGCWFAAGVIAQYGDADVPGPAAAHAGL